MKITCEHCGSVIDINDNSICPNCKATYSNNKEYKELKNNYNTMKKEAREITNRIMKRNNIVFKIGIIIFILIFITIFALPFIIDDPFNFFHNNVNYNLTVESVEFSKKPSKHFLDESDLREGYTYAVFHIYFENLSNKEMFVNYDDFNCIVDGIAQKNDTFYGDNKLPTTINEGVKQEGYLIFEVPEDTSKFQIKYKDLIVEAHI